VTRLLTDNRDKLDGLAERLLDKETVDQDEAYEAADVLPPGNTRGQLTPG
jgi:ATP-dependent Zn protease